MEQLRVVDLSKTMGITSRELIFKLRAIGVTVNSEEDTLDLSTVRAIITGETLARRPREVIQRREQQPEETTSTSARERPSRAPRSATATAPPVAASISSTTSWRGLWPTTRAASPGLFDVIVVPLIDPIW